MKALINKILKPFNVEMHGKGYLQSLAKGEFKKNAFDVQAGLLDPSKVKVIIDGGANRGDTLVKYLELFPSATIHAFEPFPHCLETLSTRFGSEPRVKINAKALSDNIDQATFYTNKIEDTNSLYEPQKTGLSSDASCENEGTIVVETVTLDAYCAENGIGEIGVLKLDLQGGEYLALQGAKELLKSRKVSLVYAESYFIRQYKNQPLFYKTATYLDEMGYQLQDIYSPIYGKNCLAWCDTIFLPKM